MIRTTMIDPRRIVRRLAWLLIVAGLGAGLCACSIAPREDPPSYGNWRDAMGEPVHRVRFSYLVDWQALDREWILLEFSGGRLFALEVRDPCIADVREARSLELETVMNNTLHRSDQVRLDDYRCLIETIRPLTADAAIDRERGSASISRRG
ncbi:MAG: DUF6491 family protein [Wenzhouxiangellaceae bacterium]